MPQLVIGKMVRSEFSSLIEDPGKLEQTSIETLKAVIEQFPYCQPAHLLLARKLRNEDSMLFEKQLNLTAAYAPSRTVLYDLINDANIRFDHVEKETEETEIEPQVAEVTREIEIENDPPEEAQKDELDQLIQSELAHDFELPQEVIESTEEVDKKKKIDADEKLVFSDWIRYLEGDEVETAEGTTEIIDRFIQDQPRINPLDSDRVSIDNLAKASSEDLDEEFVTETLAKIHLDQGNRMKAIEIYERLKFKYPEKSPYFAAQIQFIKQK